MKTKLIAMLMAFVTLFGATALCQPNARAATEHRSVTIYSGDEIPYVIREVRNTSTVPLTDFYWRDILPTDAVSLTKIVTGTYNQSLKYKILVTTNKGEQ
jgi:uncharacterized repeat protein (TIGR01451 family)